jgi:Domain of unknown function (DUF1707)
MEPAQFARSSIQEGSEMDRERQDGRQPEVRASDADRDHTIVLLRRHHVDGRLDWEEFSERMDRAARARTREDLRGLLADLPPLAERDGAGGSARQPTGQGRSRPGGPRPWPGGPGAGGPWSWRWRPWLFPPVAALLILSAVLLGALAFGAPGPGGRGFFPIFPLLFWGLLLARFLLPRRGWRRW